MDLMRYTFPTQQIVADFMNVQMASRIFLIVLLVWILIQN
ncbi:hypothetical protein BDFB_013193 [Asbolus verrucosus]|uniref:Uncharacterized protein n=1 Tax=Asbolus verrucosus TaxID=1661398 RepID=A0A482WDN8_ASBVE|nr:hypothetical protein BDFB_013193 [Asbolus verrucosus]